MHQVSHQGWCLAIVQEVKLSEKFITWAHSFLYNFYPLCLGQTNPSSSDVIGSAAKIPCASAKQPFYGHFSQIFCSGGRTTQNKASGQVVPLNIRTAV